MSCIRRGGDVFSGVFFSTGWTVPLFMAKLVRALLLFRPYMENHFALAPSRERRMFCQREKRLCFSRDPRAAGP